MSKEFYEYEEIEAAEDPAWKPEHDFTIFAEEAESSDAIPFDEDLGAALDAEFEAVLESQLEQDEDPTGFDDDIPEDEDDPDAPIGLDTLRQQIDEFAVERLGKAARKDTDFDVVIGEMDRLDRNRERRERYHEVLRGDSPLKLCKHCQKVFAASRQSNLFCSPKCKNQYNVYKSRKKNTELE